MAFRSFRVGPLKGLRTAACEAVPTLMVICGPNGVGKSSLLRLLKGAANQAEQGTKILYSGPYRPWRKAQLNMPSLFQTTYSFRDVLTMDAMPGWQYYVPPGLQFAQGTREPDSVDEAQSLVKISLARIEQKRQLYIAKNTIPREKR